MSAAERRAERLLVAYPWRFRVEHGAEIVATVLDALAPGSDRLPWADQLDLVRGGLRARWRRRLSLRAHVRYALRQRLDDRWRPWIIDDLEAPGFRWREIRRTVVDSGLVMAALFVGGDGNLVASVLIVLGCAVHNGWRAPRTQREIAARHGLVGDVPRPGWEWVLTPERSAIPNLPVARLLGAVALPLLVGGVAGVAAAARPVHIAFLDPPLHATDPVPAGTIAAACVLPAIVGLATGVVVAVHTALLARRAARTPGPASLVARRRAAVVVPVVITLVVAAVLAYGVVDVLARQLPWEAGIVGAALVPIALGLLVGVGALRRAGHRRGSPVGLWEIAPALAPRRDVVAIARGTIHLMPGAEPLPPAERPLRLLGERHPRG